MTARDGLRLGPKHGVLCRGGYIDEGVFAGPKGLKGIPDSTLSLQQSVPELRRQKFVVAVSQSDATVMGSDFSWIKSCTESEGRVVISRSCFSYRKRFLRQSDLRVSSIFGFVPFRSAAD